MRDFLFCTRDISVSMHHRLLEQLEVQRSTGASSLGVKRGPSTLDDPRHVSLCESDETGPAPLMLTRADLVRRALAVLPPDDAIGRRFLVESLRRVTVDRERPPLSRADKIAVLIAAYEKQRPAARAEVSAVDAARILGRAVPDAPFKIGDFWKNASANFGQSGCASTKLTPEEMATLRKGCSWIDARLAAPALSKADKIAVLIAAYEKQSPATRAEVSAVDAARILERAVPDAPVKIGRFWNNASANFGQSGHANTKLTPEEMATLRGGCKWIA